MVGKHQLQIALQSLKGINRSGKKVLDIGCSNGSLTCEILKTTKAQKIIGIDLDKERITKAQKLKNRRLKFLLLDANNMDVFPNDSFDVVFSNMTFQQFANFRVALKEVYRVLKPEGLAIINFNQERAELLLEIDKLKAKYFNQTRKISKDKKVSTQKFKEEARKIGFNKIKVQSKYDTCFFNSVDDLIGNQKNFKLDSEKYNKLWRELREIFKKRKTKKGYKEKWNIVFVRLIK